MNFKQLIEESDTKAGRRFDLLIQFLIVYSLITFSIETLPGLSEPMRAFLSLSELVCVLIFTAEYISRIFVADKKLRFVFSFFGMVDLFAILPFYLSTGVDLRSLRAVRLLRLLKLLRYGKAMQRMQRAFIISKDEMMIFLTAAMILLFISAAGIYYCENGAQPEVFASIFHSLWWAVATLTTVGYGDVYPITLGGKVFTSFVVMIGLGVIAVPAGIISSALSQVRREELDEEGSC